jgi:hypothetical protein
MNARLSALLLVAIAPATAAGEELRLPSADVSSVFHIEKSENRNQVHYAVTVDAQCRPKGTKPMRGYWREYEEGPRVVDSLRDFQQRAYGLSAPSSITLAEQGGDVRIRMRALPDRLLRVTTFRQGDQCRARVFTPIKKQPAVLTSIYVKVGFLYSVDYLELRGVRVADGAAVHERIDD